MISQPKHTIRADGTQEWRVDGLLHRLDGPARIWPDGHQEWWANGLLHRIAGPARIWPDGLQEWWVNGQLHRLTGPARIYADGRREWWVNGERITEQVEKWMEQQGVVWPWDLATQTQFVLIWG
jgi:hypothetical protein